ncbi:PBSX family phage terminase large subunit [Rhizorhapis sp.]|uniref:PBSX family phage terminase large subunit n=1 Tax=Rhizorhapis sp. TaxID=1968842 RepID=UPI002B4849AB|nr:PBSX family phage terminase large subunit [Rhizorhapis sp.]HKR17647.1 PBSX family phage terminase large subunit [Rhizorhapis sp.]
MKALALQIDTAGVFEPLLQPSRYKAAHGGRGSGKSWFFAGLLIEEHLANRGMRSVCIREVQKSLKESAKRLLESKIEEFGLGEKDGFKVLADRIETPGNGVIIFQGMQDHTAESIKSLEGFNRAWVEEAQTLSSRSLQLLRPTIRAPGSELWFSWNPRMRTDPVDAMFRGGDPPTNSLVVQANYSDNPWLPAELEQERLDCLRVNPDQYGHIWDGEYVTVAEGAYFAKSLALARSESRIGFVPADPLMRLRTFWDIGGTGAKADACAIWVAQFIGQQIKLVDYYEAQGQPLSAHVAWMRAQGYDGCEVVLPHDGAAHDKVYQVSYESALREAAFPVTVVPNQGAGAANIRIEAVRRLFPRMWFDETRCAGGLQALGWYHEKKDEVRGIGLGPEHDWSSHCADAFGLMAVTYKPPAIQRVINYSNRGIV